MFHYQKGVTFEFKSILKNGYDSSYNALFKLRPCEHKPKKMFNILFRFNLRSQETRYRVENLRN